MKKNTHVQSRIYQSFRTPIKNVPLYMKASAFFLLCSMGVAQAGNTYAQKTTIKVEVQNATVEKVLNKIEKDTDFSFFYNNKHVDLNRHVSIDAKNETVFEILEDLFAGTNITYSVLDKKVILTLKTDAKQQASYEVTGRVVDKNGDPIIGASVVEKGTTNGSLTDIDGKFSFSVDSKNAQIEISYVGYKTAVVKYVSGKQINVTLKEDNELLDEVVVVGYGVQRKSDLSASMTSLSEEKLAEKPVSQITDAIQGKVPGVYIQGQTGAPGSSPVIRIRGANSISTSNNPLVVVDGSMIGGGLNDINPSDIASIEILKDASATAIYGSQGANGVILVTTKSGVSGKTTVTINSFLGIQNKTKELDLMDALEYATNVNVRRSVGKNNGNPNDLNGPKSKITSDPNYNYYSEEWLNKFRAGEMCVNWQDEIYRTALTQNHQMTLRSGNEKNRIMLSLNYAGQEGIMLNTKYQKLSGRLKTDTQINKQLKVGTNLSVLRSKNNPQDRAAYYALYSLPTGSVYKEDGSYFNNRESKGWGNSSPNSGSSLWNPVAAAKEPEIDNYRTEVVANGYLEYEILKGLKFKSTITGSLYDNSNNSFFNQHTSTGWGKNGGEASISNSRGTNWQNTNTLNYIKQFGDHSLNATAMFEQHYSKWSSNYITGKGFVDPSKLYHDMAAAEEITSKGSNTGKSTMLSYLGRVNYSYKSKYIFTGAIRADGSSKFSSNNKWAYFPSASAAWRVTGEEFMKNVDFISDLKVRASWGMTGNQGISPYETMLSLGMGGGWNYPMNGSDLMVGTGYPGSMANKDIKWETTKQADFGIDLSLFNNKLSFIVDYYHKKTDDLLLWMNLPQYSGYGSVRSNIGAVENKGWEFAVESNLGKGDFHWNGAFNIATNKNKVTALSTENEERMYVGNNVSYVIKGQPLGSFYGYKYEGVFLPGEEAEAEKYGQQIGTPKIKDINKDGKFDSEDKTVIGNPNPDFTFGFSNKFDYKNFSLSFFIQGAIGNEIYNASARGRFDYEDVGGNGYRGKKRWHPVLAPDGYYCRYEYDNVLNLAFPRKEAWNSTMFVEDGSYVRLKNITLSYNVPRKVLGNWGLNGARVYTSIDNLLTWTDYTGYDPEAGASGNDSSNGVDNGIYPNVKTFMFGLELTF